MQSISFTVITPLLCATKLVFELQNGKIKQNTLMKNKKSRTSFLSKNHFQLHFYLP